jgi:hypothetical protein
MAIMPILNQYLGPMPISLTFTSPTDGEALIEVSGSVSAPNANVIIGIQVLIDGEPVGAAQIFSNNPNVHRVVVPVWVKAPPDFKQHTLTLQVLNRHTASDSDDFYNATLAY